MRDGPRHADRDHGRHGAGRRGGDPLRGGEALETAGRVDTVVFDKTGTLTLGRPEVSALRARLRAHAAGVAGPRGLARARSEHPLGEAIVRRAREGELGFQAVDGFEAIVFFSFFESHILEIFHDALFLF